MRASATVALALCITTAAFGSAFLFVSFKLDRRTARYPGIYPSKIPPRYGSCRVNADCPRGEACAVDEMDHLECRPDECERDQDCLPGRVCRRVPGLASEPGPRMCVQKGVRKEGERCTDIPTNAKEGCEANLYCQHLFCGRPCQLDRPESCPNGFVCRQGIDRPSCLPSCEGQSCPAGKQCIRFQGKSFSACFEVVGENCQVTPCPPGRECNYLISDDSDRIAMACDVPCKGNATCPQGTLCHFGFCAQQCWPRDKKACKPNRACMEIDRELSLFACALDP